MEDKKNIEVVSGDGSNLNISPAYDDINDVTPTSADNKPTHIVIPKETIKIIKKDNEKNNESSNSKKDENE